MRIIAGEFRSRRLLTPKDDSVTRPIPDRVKESLFGMLRGHCEEASVFDAFAGTGAIGLEAVSRGAARCVMVEKDRGAADILRKNVEALGVEDRCEIVVGDALGAGALSRCPRPLDLAFFDPPYPLIRDAIGWKRVRAQFEAVVGLLTDDGFAVLRTPWPFMTEAPDPNHPAPTAPVRRRKERPRHWRYLEQVGKTRDADPEVEIEKPPEAPEPGMIYTPAELTLSNATGPETHAYHSMAVHLYMRKR